MTQIKAVLFDKDGTLFDFAATWDAWAMAFLLRMCGQDRQRAAQIGDAIGFDMETARILPGSIVVAGTPLEIADRLTPYFPGQTQDDITEILNQEAATAPQAEAVPLAPLLDRLRAMGLGLGVATNDGEAPALAHLDSAGIRDRFDFIAGSDSGFGGKPAPGQMFGFCDAMNLLPESCVMVGDSLHDLHAGRAAGMKTVGVLTGHAPRSELSPHADAVLPDIGHLPDWLVTYRSARPVA